MAAPRSWILFVAIVFSIVLSTRIVMAQQPNAGASAEDLKNRGNQAMMELNYAEALSAYRASLEKNPSDVALHYNIGRAYQARGEYAQALDALMEFDKKAPAETKAKVPSLAQLLADVRSHVGELSIRCAVTVPKGTILVGDSARFEGGCTATPKVVRVSLASKASKIEVRLESDSHQAPATTLTIEGGSPPVDVLLQAQPKTNAGVLRIQAAPAVASIAVDGVLKGNSPVEVLLPPGSHAVDVSADGYESAHSSVVMEAGGRREVNLSLDKTPPITKRWWFWAGSGLIVAGITTVVVILVVQPERDSSKGTIDPGVIRAPLVTF